MQNMYEAFLGVKNRIYYLAKFEQFDKQGPGLKASWNWPAFFCLGIWALYRKMYGWFFAYLGISILLQISVKNGYPGFGALIFIVPWFAFSILANSLYHNSVKKKIAVAQFTFKDETKLLEFLRYKGGVNTWVFWSSGLLTVASIVAVIVIAIYLSQSKQVQSAPRNIAVDDPFKARQTPSTPVDPNNIIVYAPPQTPSVLQLDDLRRATDTAPSNAKVWINLGNALMDATQYGQAVEAYDKALALGPDNVNVLVDQGTCYRGLGKFNTAVEQYRKALNINPNDSNGHRNLGVVLSYDLNDPSEGVKEFQRYIELAPNAPDADQIRQTISQLKAIAK